MNLSRNAVLDTLQKVFDDVFIEHVQVHPKLAAKEVPEWDSLTHMTLVINVEKTFAIRFRMGEVETMENVGGFADLILKRVNETF